MWTLTGCEQPRAPERVCFDDGRCIEPDGTWVNADGEPICELNGTCPDVDTSDSGDDTPTEVSEDVPCLCESSAADSDGDCIDDSLEAGAGADSWDSDGDGIGDGCEDANQNGQVDVSGDRVTETDPFDDDSDDDGIKDGIEDADHDGRFDANETHPLRADTDGDGIDDGVEDRNLDGEVALWVDADGDGCFTDGDEPGESDPRTMDSDMDLIADYHEDQNLDGLCGIDETCAFLVDTDCDALPDGREDKNRDGVFNSHETDPLRADSDADGILDGLEDANQNGVWDRGLETSPRHFDSDGDHIADGVEDRNQNGRLDGFEDTNDNGVWEISEPQGESDPRVADSDSDGLIDSLEDLNQDGWCDSVTARNPLRPAEELVLLAESCAWLPDSDGDGLEDGVEDANLSGNRELGETDPRRADTDFDGLTDGCPTPESVTCEDLDLDGVVDSGETDPLIADTDGDGLTDGCEVLFDVANCPDDYCGTDPLSEDTDGDGLFDGEEDQDASCSVDSGEGETDPRSYDEPPPTESLGWSEWNVCASQNLRQLTYATSSRPTHDYRLALRVESRTVAAECGNGAGDCAAGQTCEGGFCTEPVSYFLQAFGKDTNDNGFNPDELGDQLWGHVFESPRTVEQDLGDSRILNQDLYGFLVLDESSDALDDVLDTMRQRLAESFVRVEEQGVLTVRPAHDNLPAAAIVRSERQLQIDVAQAMSSLQFRNMLLTDVLLDGAIADPPEVTSGVDPVYGDVDCSIIERCYTSFTVYLSAVLRRDQLGPDGEPVLLLLLALTPNDSESSYEAARRYVDRLARLRDLTGGTALGRFDAGARSRCESQAQARAKADVLWAVDDSRSMQQIIERLGHAARDARAVFSSNSGIVDFRLAMTTTNSSGSAQTICPDLCDASCSAISGVNESICLQTCADQTIGCIKTCPEGCDTNCSSLSGQSCDATLCESGCVADVGAASFDALPGAGGTFYYEDSAFLDCDSRPVDFSDISTYQRRYFNSCADEDGFDSFFGTGGSRKALVEHARFLGSAPDASCSSALMDLSYAIDPAITGCLNDDDCVCERLTESCEDAPRVLASSMCDLIRTMGGLPSPGGETSGARPHSAPEHGTRSVRRLLASLVPALPRDWQPSDDANGYEPSLHLRLECSKSEAGCVPCTPGVDTDCQPVPLVTIILSDEEDFFFKDDCRESAALADLSALPSQCRYLDGNSETLEDCTVDYCDAAGFLTGIPAGYDPDSFAASSSRESTQLWRDQNAPECSALIADAAVSCVGDPCAGLSEASACQAWDGTLGVSCAWNSGAGFCQNRCGTLDDQESCSEDAECRWEPAYAQGVGDPCVSRRLINDCQPCKRLRRALQAQQGGDAIGTSLRAIGPVYAMIRNKGEPGAGVLGTDEQDRCEGGAITWGRGDGQAYRDLAIGTLGRTQDVCAEDYRDFMQRLVGDLAVLSAPYALSDAPIASTLKVGIARPRTDGGTDFIDVPRSETSGFIYDADQNSIGFKSDPVDGECGDASCSLDGQIEDTEIGYARTAPHVPLEGDAILISYRAWQPVPCLDACADDETCVRTVCHEDSMPGTCSGDDATLCSIGYGCEDDTCVLSCELGEVVDRCVPATTCESCETIDSSLSCEPVDNACSCDDSDAIRCDPDGVDVCPMGWACSSGCTCEPISDCDAGFTLDGQVSSCTLAEGCCEGWMIDAQGCVALDEVSCTGDGACRWNDATSLCEITSATCCEPDETFWCEEIDEATGVAEVSCIPSCVCDPPCGDTQYCCVECGCECRDNSP